MVFESRVPADRTGLGTMPHGRETEWRKSLGREGRWGLDKNFDRERFECRESGKINMNAVTERLV